MRKCKKCGSEKPLDQFEMTNRERGWRRHECKVCTKKRVQSWNEKSKQHLQEYHRQYHQANRDKKIAMVAKWAAENPGNRRQNALAYYYRLQHAAMTAYGGYECSWCGIDEPLVLCIDHVHNDGNVHRREIDASGAGFYKWLRDNGYPEGFQVLCANCNHAKHRNGGELPESLKGRCNDHPAREYPASDRQGKRPAPHGAMIWSELMGNHERSSEEDGTRSSVLV